MKNTSKILTLLTIFVAVLNGNAQNNTSPMPVSGNVGIGITSPNANLQLYGTTDYITGGGKGNPTINHGKTSRIILTNTNTGSGAQKRLDIRMSQLNGIIENQEAKNLTLKSGGAFFTLDGVNGRINSNLTAGNDVRYAKFNLLTNGDNGIFIRTITAGKYGIRTSVINANDNALEVVVGNAATPVKNFIVTGGGQVKMLVDNGTTNALEVANTSDVNEKNFTVTGGGNVFARKYTTTLANIPDYVFEPTYELMPLDSLASYIELNKHLPNVPSATEYEKEGVDLGEMNRLLLEKAEELTLYVLQLSKEIDVLKEEKKETPTENNTSESETTNEEVIIEVEENNTSDDN